MVEPHPTAEKPRVYFIRHQGTDILFIDFSYCTLDDFAAIIDSAKKIIAVQPPKSLLTLSDFTETRYNKETIARLRPYVEHNKPFVKAAAVLGITGLKRVVYNAICQLTGRNLTVFEKREDALDWLVRQ